MRTIEEIKKEQEQCLRDLGFHACMSEQFKAKVFVLAKEMEALQPPVKAEETKEEE